MNKHKKNKHRDIRFLVTQKCCYRCPFCHGEGLQSTKKDKLKAEDFVFLFKNCYKNFNIKTATLTGGEPLVRKDICEIAKSLKKEGANLTLTTNGYFLEEKLEIGQYIDKMNVSFHSFDKKTYEKMVGKKGTYEKALRGIYKIREEYPNLNIFLNATIFRGLNSQEDKIKDLIKFANKTKSSIKFVELFPSNLPESVSLEEIKKILLKMNFKKDIINDVRKKYYLSEDKKEKVYLTRIFCATASKHKNPGKFCNQHNDLFVSPDGKIKPCRNNPFEVSILKEVKNRNTFLLKRKIKKAIKNLGKNCSKFIMEDYTSESSKVN